MKSSMKWIVGIIIVAILGLGFFAYTAYRSNYTGDAYYVRITTDGTKRIDKADNGKEEYVDYSYNLPGYTEKGDKLDLEFNANKDRPLRKGAYLKVDYNQKRKQVLSWEEVQEKDVPAKALDKIK